MRARRLGALLLRGTQCFSVLPQSGLKVANCWARDRPCLSLGHVERANRNHQGDKVQRRVCPLDRPGCFLREKYDRLVPPLLYSKLEGGNASVAVGRNPLQVFNAVSVDLA